MKRRRFPGALAASLGVVVEGSLTEFARPHSSATALASLSGQASKMSEFPQNSTIILVHGAWADGSGWHNVILPLERRGCRVICAPIPLTSLTNDATALSWALERSSGPVVLVGHAYSAAVIAAVREDRVKSLVYISALARGRDRGPGVLSQPVAFGSAEVGSRFPRLYMDAAGWVSPRSCPQGFSRSNKHCNCRATADRGSVHSRAGPDAGMENETVVVPDRRRGSHDQSENPAFHGRPHARKSPFLPCGPQPDVHGAKSCDQHNPGSGA